MPTPQLRITSSGFPSPDAGLDLSPEKRTHQEKESGVVVGFSKETPGVAFRLEKSHDKYHCFAARMLLHVL
jgi:hypothetical protein